MKLSTRILIFRQICIFLACVMQIQSISVSREGLREEHLLPVRMAREAVFEGSGDDDNIPIQTLNSAVMERMTLAEGENKILDSGEAIEDGKSKETTEDIDEGSGFDEDGQTTTTTEKNIVNNTSRLEEHETTTEVTTAKEEETTPIPKVTDVTEIILDTTTVKEEVTIPQKTTVAEVTTTKDEVTIPQETTITEITTEKKEVTTSLPETVTTIEVATEGKETTTLQVTAEIKTEPETTTLKPEATTTKEDTTILVISNENEKSPATELIELKTVNSVLAELPLTTTIATTTTKEEVTTLVSPKETEREPVSELIELKKVNPILAETPITAVTTFDNGTLLENENLTIGTGTLLMKSDSRFLDTSEKVLEGSKDPSRLGTYIVISLILLSFLSLIGFILMKRRVEKRRKKSNMDPETLDTEKALLSLSEYKDHPDDEGKIKNNEITPIVIKSNSQINKFEKNTNFSSPKNLNTKANEKNLEKDNVLKENLTQVIIEEAAKDADEEKATSNAEKLIVRTHLDQDSIPKKPVIVNRTSLGCVPVSQE